MFNKNNISWADHDGLRECVKSRVKQARFEHILGVEQESEKLAGIFEYPETGRIKSAALLHDITKELEKSEQLELCERYCIELGGHDMLAPKALHAKTAAHVARDEFGACNIIFNAVYRHTFGAPRGIFDLPSKIIYLADYIEPGRTFQDCVDVREHFYKNLGRAASLEHKLEALDGAILFSLDKTLGALITEGAFIHKSTVKNRNSFI